MIDQQGLVDGLFTTFGRDVTWQPKTGPSATVKLRRAAPPETRQVLTLETGSDGFVWVARTSEIECPVKGDRFHLADGRAMEIQSDPQRFGRHELQWIFDAAEVEP